MEKPNFFEIYPDVNPDVIIAVAKCNIFEFMAVVTLIATLIYLGHIFHKKEVHIQKRKTIVGLICVAVVIIMAIVGALTIAAQFK